MLAILGCDTSGSPSGDASTDDAPALDEVRGCTSASECAIGVNYRDETSCALPAAFNTYHLGSEPCITAIGEIPGASCLECPTTVDSGRGGRLAPGYSWNLDCEAGLCVASETPCGPDVCPTNSTCSSSLDCFLGYHCLASACTEGCNTGFDCRLGHVCVRDPPDSAWGRCVFSG